jgi:outer membrane protein assembly factor BamB
MKTGSLHTVAVRLGAVSCGIALAASAAAVSTVMGCASAPSPHRDASLEKALQADLGFSGRELAVDLAQAGNVDLIPTATRLQGDFLVLVEVPNRIEALNRDSLNADWAYHSLPGAVRYPPTLTPISMLLMSDNELHQVDLRYGHAQGPAIHFDMAPSSSFGGTAGTAYVPCWGGSSGEKTLRTLNLVTGLEGWGWRVPGDIRGGVIVGGQPPRQTVYFGTDAGEVYAIPAAEAASRAPAVSWSRDTRGPVTAPLTLDGEELFVASESGFLYSLDRITGLVKWAAAHETPLVESPYVTKKFVYQHRAGWMWCHDRASGKVLWKVQGAARFIVEREGKAVVTSDDGSLWTVAENGSVVGKMPMGGYYFPTNLRDDSLFAVSADGLVFKLERGGE